MEEHRRTRFDERGLVGGRRPGLRAGAVHYWRAPASTWPALCAAIAKLGCTAVDTPVPWAVHERAGGGFDWAGDRDLPAFLAAAAAAGLDAVLRPGPWVEAQLTFGGLPERVVRDPDIAARAAHGGPAWLPHPPRAHPLPSLASTRYRAEVAAWLAEVGRVIGPHLAPGGPVVALAIDHHAVAVYRAGAFDLDYHPDAVAWWREHDDREPPTRWADDDDERCVAWVRWKERYLARGLGELARALDAAGLGGVARFHAAPPATPWHADLPAIERAIGGPVSIDVSGGGADLTAIRTRGLWVAGSSRAAAPVSVGCGHAPYLPPRTDAEQRAAALTALAAGARGLSITMAVARDRWIGGALSSVHPERTPLPGHPERTTLPGHPERTTLPGHPERTTLPGHPERTTLPGHPERSASSASTESKDASTESKDASTESKDASTESKDASAESKDPGATSKYDWLVLLAALARLGWDGLHRRARVALVASRADARHGLASSVIDPAPPLLAELLALGPGGSAELGRDADAVTYRRWFAAAAAALDLARVPFAIVDESAGVDRLLAFDAIVAPTLRRVDRDLWRDLAAAAAAKKTVVYGPEQPTLDELGQPLGDDAKGPRRAGRMRPGSVDDVAGLAEDLAALVDPEPWVIERPAGLHVDAFDDDAGHTRAVIVSNPGAGPARARLLAPANVQLVDMLGGQRIDVQDGHATIALAAGDARLFKVIDLAAPDARVIELDQKK